MSRQKEIAFWGFVPGASLQSRAFMGWTIAVNPKPGASDDEGDLSEGDNTNTAYDTVPNIGTITWVDVRPPTGYHHNNYKLYAGIKGQQRPTARVALALAEDGPYVRASEGLSLGVFDSERRIWVKTILPSSEPIVLWMPAEGFVKN